MVINKYMELLNKIQKELKAPKSQYNTFGKYSYRNCQDILEAVKPLLGTGVLILEDEVVQLGTRYYVKATAHLHDGGTLVSATAYAREAEDKKGMDDAQITGAASSYARKYALNGLFCIDDTKDADNDALVDKTPVAAKQVAKTAPVKAPVTVEHEILRKKKAIQVLCDEIAIVPLVTRKEYETYVRENTGLELNNGNLDEVITRLNARLQ